MLNRLFIYCYFILLALFLFPHPLKATEIGGDDANPFSIYYDEKPDSMVAGSSTSLKFLFQIPKDYYLYADKLTVELNPPSGISLKEAIKPAAEIKMDPYLEKEVEIYHNELAIDVPLGTAATLAPGGYVLDGVVKLQGCSTELCFRPMTYPVSINITIGGSDAGVKVEKADESSFFEKIRSLIKTDDFENVLNFGFLWAVLIAFVGGVLTDLTPCVWPMIPVTLAIIGLRQEKSALKNLFNVLVLVLGMAFTYSILGVTVAFLGKSLGFLFQNIGFLILLDLFLFLMALSLFGLFDLALPQSLNNFLARLSTSGLKGIFLTGATLGLMAAPCVGPIIGPLLVYVAKTQNLTHGFVLMFVYALGMGTIFIVLGTFYGFFKGRVTSGSWMVAVKKTIGVLVLAVALYYGYNIYERLSPPTNHLDKIWVTSLDEALSQARENKKPVIIDFFATWCLPCIELDKTVFSNPQIKEELTASWTPLKIDCSESTPTCEEAIKRYKVIGWPTVIFLNSSQEEVAESRLVGKVVTVDEMMEILKKVKGNK